MKRTYFYLVLLIIINIIIYHTWISFSIFAFSDWQFHFSNALANLAIPTTWNTTFFYNYGAIDNVIWRLPIYLLNGYFGNLGLDFNIAEKFLYFWPIIFVTSLGSFFLIRYILKSTIGAFVGSLVFSFNTYFLSIDTQGHQLLTVAFAFATFAILFYLKLLEKKRLYLAIISGIFLFIVGAYDLRSLYITIGITGLYLLYFMFINFDEIKKNFFKIFALGITPFILLFILSLYWLLPILNEGALTSNTALGKQIFGSQFYNIQSSLTTFFPFWTGGETAWFTVQQIHWYFWLYPIIAILGLIKNKKNTKVLFFSLIAMLGIFLSKQADIPFAYIYGWLYKYVPGLNAFREASKFDFMISLGYAVLIGGFTTWVWSRNWEKKISYVKYIIITTIVFIALWNAKPIVTGEIKSLFIPHRVPQEILTVKNLIDNQPDYFRTYWINMNLNWLLSNNTHPQIEGRQMLRSDWNPFFENIFANKKRAEGENMILALRSERMNRLLDLSSVKYVITLLHDNELDTDITDGFGKKHQYYQSELSKISYLKKIDKMPNNILIYENSNFRPHIYVTEQKETLSKTVPYSNISYTEISPSEYKISLRKITKPLYLNITENFHQSWKIRIGEFNWIDVLWNNKYLLSDENHLRSEIGFNAFYINPKRICSKFECKRNQDGSYNLNMTLYFKPQSYLYLGMIISGATLAISFVYLIYYGIKKIHAKR